MSDLDYKIVLDYKELNKYFAMFWLCISVQFLLINNLTHFFNVGGCLVCRSETCIPDSHRHRVMHTRWCIDSIDSPDDEHWVARNM